MYKAVTFNFVKPIEHDNVFRSYTFEMGVVSAIVVKVASIACLSYSLPLG